jgi:hypothetical protein
VKRPVALLVLGLSTALSALTWTQTTGDRIDFYFSDWHSSARRTTHGSLPQRLWRDTSLGDFAARPRSYPSLSASSANCSAVW